MSIVEKFKRTSITWLFLVLSLLVFMVARIMGPEHIDFLVFNYNKFPERWYTIFTYGIVHKDWYHIILNMLALVFIGYWVELLVGSKKYLIIVITSVLAGGLSMYLRQRSGIGFSAATSGFLCYYYFAFPWEKETFLNIPNLVYPIAFLVFSVLAIIFGWFPNVGHVPHLAGALIGIIFLIVFHKKHDLKIFDELEEE